MDNEKNSVGAIISQYMNDLVYLYPEEEIRAILYRLFDSEMGWSRATVQLNKGFLLTRETSHQFARTLDRLKRGEPIQYIIGHIEFCGLSLTVQPGVLIPRPETEELAVMITRDNQMLRNQPVSILDIGTGSGCLALAMKKAFPLAWVTGTDISPDALEIARQNAQKNQLEVDFILEDILGQSTTSYKTPLQIIVSNPPYIPENEMGEISHHVKEHEPGHALFVPADNPLLFYPSISVFAKNKLAPGGMLYTDVHEKYGENIAEIYRNVGIRQVVVLPDLFGKQRFVKGSLPG